jgi:hypothetical protein
MRSCNDAGQKYLQGIFERGCLKLDIFMPRTAGGGPGFVGKLVGFIVTSVSASGEK